MDEKVDSDEVKSSSENAELSAEVELLLAADDASNGLNLFLNDKFEEAMDKVKDCFNKSLYHTAGYAFLHFMQACLTMEPSDIELALEVLQKTSEICDEKRHGWTFTDNAITKLFAYSDYNSYTEEEVHAELLYAEIILARALLTFIQDDNFLSFIRGGIRVRTSFLILKECYVILQHRKWPNLKLKEHFETGVLLGLGTFNLIISSLPKRILKLLEFIGFSGNKDLAMEMLEAGHAMQNGLRSPLCSLTNISHHLIGKHISGKGLKKCDLDYASKLLVPLREKCPKSTLILYYSGRCQLLKGNIKEAVSILKTSVSGDITWVKFRQLPHWELFFSYIILGEYRNALECVDLLLKGSNWSKSLNSYMKAIVLFMCDDVTEDESQEMIELMKQVPGSRQRRAGKSIPPEKYFAFRAERFVAQNNWLPLPTFEMLYAFNYLLVIKGNNEIFNPILARINCVLADLNEDRHKDCSFYMDNLCLALLMKGLCLSYAGNVIEAKQYFYEVYDNRESIKEDHYVVSCALLELGLIYLDNGKYDKAIDFLERAKVNVSYFVEFRIHNALEEIEKLKNGDAV